MNMEPKSLDEMTFREAMAELDGIVARLESNTMELEDCLKGYERGVALLAELQKRLNEAEQKVSVLMGELSGEKDDAERDTTLS
ncbi:MAG: exodeoxyribonuclease VII small subunit [Eggerthellaceae bacterium]|nr:exodeoxyribonuclease VII small subunit [Eggerthellaceae bacterium]